MTTYRIYQHIYEIFIMHGLESQINLLTNKLSYHVIYCHISLIYPINLQINLPDLLTYQMNFLSTHISADLIIY